MSKQSGSYACKNTGDDGRKLKTQMHRLEREYLTNRTGSVGRRGIHVNMVNVMIQNNEEVGYIQKDQWTVISPKSFITNCGIVQIR